MADKNLDVTIDDKEVHRMVGRLLNKLDNPEPLLKRIGRYIRAQTKKMFTGRRPDNSTVRGESWPKLAPSTIKVKRAAVKRGKAIVADRPLVRTGRLRDDLMSPKALQIRGKGLEYGTDRRSRKGYPYPAIHNVGDPPRIPQRRWLFLNHDELNQIAHMTKEYLEGQLRSMP